MIDRALLSVIHNRLKRFPAVALLGPRQSGKTTLAATLSKTYYDLELETERLRLDLQWDDTVRSEDPVILDEAQNYPEIFPRIRNAVDRDRQKNGRFVILGSVSPGLMRHVSEFLTGRIAICELFPLILAELDEKRDDDLWLAGGFPDGGILEGSQFPTWQKNYLDVLAMRDLPVWGLPASPPTTKRLFKMVAASHGNTWTASTIGKSMGLSYHTVNSYLDYLEQAYLVRRIQPYVPNVRKRLIKSPKVYWRDSGLLHALMNVRSMDDLLIQPWVGASWEGWLIEQILGSLNNKGIDHDVFFFRTSDGHELDLVLQLGGRTWAFEMKLSSSPDRSDLDRLTKAADMIGAEKRVLVSKARREVRGENAIMTNARGVLSLIEEM
jgi:predicted AAA+ superfamily ATPase